MSNHLARRIFAGFLLASMMIPAAGCGDTLRQSIEGVVTLDGRPLAEGSIQLLPREGTRGPSAGALIKDGRFSIDASKGAFAGTFRVEITAMRQGKQVRIDPETGGKYLLNEQYLPARYNTKSELTADIKEGQPNKLEFALVSK
ncbi:MAG TPA: hypothetical protein VJL29_13500 [Thermoguttaceae bacterium]|nr:hypothetical protein [Thermoguttaceae bacterium]